MKRHHANPSSSPLPSLYASWADELLGGPIPHETEATCDDCAMCPGPKDQDTSAYFFRPDAKCCTYIPFLPNFLVGRILNESDPRLTAGRASVEARLNAGIGATPLGLAPSRAQSLLYIQGTGAAFGRNRTLRCPHYLETDGGLCGIWLHRNAVCATWYCKHVQGATGDRFWKTLAQLLSAVEGTLAQWCVLELGLNTDALARLFPRRDPSRSEPLEPGEIDGVADAPTYRGMWGNWWNREREFYKRSVRLVNALSWADVLAIAGQDVRIFARLVQEAYKGLMSNEVPERLVAGSFHSKPMGQDASRVTTYSPYDPLALPKDVVDLLPYFDGRPTAEILRRIQKEKGVRLSKALLRKLVDFEILIPPSPPTGGGG